jgi:hypothetical protein
LKKMDGKTPPGSKAMSSEFQPMFAALRAILRKHCAGWTVQEDSVTCYSLTGRPGPATLRAWSGKLKKPIIPLAWVQIGKAYVSYHLMGVYGNPALLARTSKELKARMQGKSCFNFNTIDPALLRELDELTAQSIASFKKAGYVE